jgi:hypothetical protein
VPYSTLPSAPCPLAPHSAARIAPPIMAAPPSCPPWARGVAAAAAGYSWVLTGTHGYARVLTGTLSARGVAAAAAGYARVLTGTHGYSIGPRGSRCRRRVRTGTHGYSRVLTDTLSARRAAAARRVRTGTHGNRNVMRCAAAVATMQRSQRFIKRRKCLFASAAARAFRAPVSVRMRACVRACACACRARRRWSCCHSSWAAPTSAADRR